MKYEKWVGAVIKLKDYGRTKILKYDCQSERFELDSQNISFELSKDEFERQLKADVSEPAA